MGNTFLYIGSWVDKKGNAGHIAGPDGKILEPGIAVCRFDTETGGLSWVSNCCEKEFTGIGKCWINTATACLYATDEREDYPGLKNGGGGGTVRSYRIDPEQGTLHFMNQMPSFGAKPSYVCGDGGKYLLLTNHGTRSKTTVTACDAFGRYHVLVQHDEANVVLYPLGADGSLGEPTDIFRLSGCGPAAFQQSSHAHSVNKAPGRNLYAVCDKGGDQVYMLRINYEKQRIEVCPDSPAHRKAGSAPRYSAFHPFLPCLYVNKEADARLSVFHYTDQGKLDEVQVVENTIPEGYMRPTAPFQSDLLVDMKGKCCYLFMRDVDLIVCYAIDHSSGTLTYVGAKETKGSARMGAFSPDGRYLAVSYPFDNIVEIIRVSEDGTLEAAVSEISLPAPATLNFFQS